MMCTVNAPRMAVAVNHTPREKKPWDGDRACGWVPRQEWFRSLRELSGKCIFPLLFLIFPGFSSQRDDASRIRLRKRVWKAKSVVHRCNEGIRGRTTGGWGSFDHVSGFAPSPSTTTTSTTIFSLVPTGKSPVEKVSAAAVPVRGRNSNRPWPT